MNIYECNAPGFYGPAEPSPRARARGLDLVEQLASCSPDQRAALLQAALLARLLDDDDRPRRRRGRCHHCEE